MVEGNGCLDPKRQAFEKELLKLTSFLRAFSRSLVGERDLADDLTQNALVSALEAWESFKEGSNMKAWLFTILRNEFYSHRRRAWRQVSWDDADMGNRAVMPEVESVDEFRRLLLCLACIPQEMSDALVAVGYAGMSYVDATRVLGCAEGTVKSRVARGRNKLRKLLDGVDTIDSTNIDRLKTVTRGVPKSHKFYEVAQQYEELYAHLDGPEPKQESQPKRERLWQELVASGALDGGDESIEDLMHFDPSEI